MKLLSLSNLHLKLFINLSFILFLISCQPKSEDKNNIQTIHTTNIPKKVSSIKDSKFLKEDVLLEYVTKSPIIKPNPKNGIPFNKLDYDKVIAYDFEGSEESYPSVISKYKKFVPVVLKQKALSQIQADQILSILTKNSTYGEATAACFNPHFALVLYKNNKAINQINICLSCNYLIADLAIPAETHLIKNKETANEYSLTGFTKSGTTAITSLCKELGFFYNRI